MDRYDIEHLKPLTLASKMLKDLKQWNCNWEQQMKMFKITWEAVTQKCGLFFSYGSQDEDIPDASEKIKILHFHCCCTHSKIRNGNGSSCCSYSCKIFCPQFSCSSYSKIFSRWEEVSSACFWTFRSKGFILLVLGVRRGSPVSLHLYWQK